MISLPLLGEIATGTLAASFQFYVVSLLLLIGLGIGPALLLLPEKLRPLAWGLSPYIGYSLLTVTSSLLVGAGLTVAWALGLAGVLGMLGLAVVARRGRLHAPTALLPVVLLSLPGYSVAALTMAHDGTTGYAGPLWDAYIFFRLAEWLKFHPAPIFGDSWYSYFPPLDGWAEPGVRLEPRSGDPLLALQQGVFYWEGAIGILLDWDAGLVFRPAQAFLLSMAAPAVYLLTSQVTGFRLAAWGAGLLLAGAAVAALLSGYYQGAPLLAALTAPIVFGELIQTSSRKRVLPRFFGLGFATAVAGLVDHIRVIRFVTSGRLYYGTSGYGEPAFPSPGEALGTAVTRGSIGPGWESEVSKSLASLAEPATVVGLLLAVAGLVMLQGKLARPLRYSLLGTALTLVYLRLTEYPYGYNKAQAVSGFLMVILAACGASELSRRLGRLAVLPVAAFAGVLGLALVNAALVEASLWKGLRNVWGTEIWEAASLTNEVLPGEPVRLSPFVQGSDEAVATAAYFIRNGRAVGAYTQSYPIGDHVVVPTDPSRRRISEGGVEVLDARELPEARGLEAQDLVWSNRLLAMYRRTDHAPGAVSLEKETGKAAALPVELPVTIRVQDESDGEGDGYLLMVVAVEATPTLRLESADGERILALSYGLAVRTIPVPAGRTATLSVEGGRATLLSVALREGADPGIDESVKRSAAAVAGSYMLSGRLVSEIATFDAWVPFGTSFEVYGKRGSDRKVEVPLSVSPDGLTRTYRIELDPVRPSPLVTLNGKNLAGLSEPPSSGTERLPDGEYVAYLATWSGDELFQPRRTPLYRYVLRNGSVTEYESFPQAVAWTDEQR